ncbi:MAG: hypothetical protein HY767_02810, partial [Candidatus Omnitrophica bacterium]|nr:hypothetical protein [Candidatus Omnitrophota bacterium]
DAAFLTFNKVTTGSRTSYSWASLDGNTSHSVSLEKDPNAPSGERASYNCSIRVAKDVLEQQAAKVVDAGQRQLLIEALDASKNPETAYATFYQQITGDKTSFSWSSIEGNSSHSITIDAADANRASYTKQERVSREQIVNEMEGSARLP